MTTIQDLDPYLQLGWNLLPCGEKTKIGIGMSWRFATRYRAKVAWWARRWPDANWAIHCGPVSGVVVVDVDGPEGEVQLRGLRRSHGLPMAPQCLSGGASAGQHLYFAWPSDRRQLRNALRLGPKLEVRAHKHLVLLPPSRHPKTGWEYRWLVGRAPWEMPLPQMPGWLLDAMAPPPPVEHKPIDLGQISDRYVQAALAGEVKAVAAAVNGCRNETLNRSTFRLVRFVRGGVLEAAVLRETMMQAALQAGLDQVEAQATIRSAMNANATAVTRG